jgi:hypothetical protein
MREEAEFHYFMQEYAVFVGWEYSHLCQDLM